MPRVKPKEDAVLMRTRYASNISGLSEKHIRAGCLAGIYPCVFMGNEILVNMPLFLEQINAESRKNTNLSEMVNEPKS